jgi:hypothetical protein
VVATFHRAGAVQWEAQQQRLPRRDLFAKRVWGLQGRGAERWSYDPATERWNRHECGLTEAELLAHLRARARLRSVLLQHCLANHADLSRFSAGPLCTFRVVTHREDSGVELLGMMLKLPTAGSEVDNLHAGGLACAVDPVTGKLGPGIAIDPSADMLQFHPDSGHLIEGATLTTHRDAIALALDAHRQLDIPWSIGWDVAMTPDGPAILEGNTGWAVDLFHIPHGKGLPDEFTKRLVERVEARLA